MVDSKLDWSSAGKDDEKDTRERDGEEKDENVSTERRALTTCREKIEGKKLTDSRFVASERDGFADKLISVLEGCEE